MKILVVCISILINIAYVSAQNFVYNGINYSIIDFDQKTCTTQAGDLWYPGTEVRENVLILPDLVYADNIGEWFTLTEIGFSSFVYQDFTEIWLPNSLVKINEWAFNGCANLESVHFPESLREIGYMGFAACHKMTSIEIPYGVEYIADAAFGGAVGRKKLWLPASIKEIGPNISSGEIFLATPIPPTVVDRFKNITSTDGSFYKIPKGTLKRYLASPYFLNEPIETDNLPPILLDNFDLRLRPDEEYKINVSLNAEGLLQESCEWHSSNESVIKVDSDGNLSTIGKGQAVITCKVYNDKGHLYYDECNINVRREESIELSLAIEKPKISINVGEKTPVPVKIRGLRPGKSRIAIQAVDDYGLLYYNTLEVEVINRNDVSPQKMTEFIISSNENFFELCDLNGNIINHNVKIDELKSLDSGWYKLNEKLIYIY